MRRLALLVTGRVAAPSPVLARTVVALRAPRLTAATTADSINRRLRRTRRDPLLSAAECVAPFRRTVIAWPASPRTPVILAIDASSQEDRLPLFGISLPDAGPALPLVWTRGEQNVPQPHGAYWAMVGAALARRAAVLAAGVTVWVGADRFCAIAPLLDRLTASGWQWVIRITTPGRHRIRDAHGREWARKTGGRVGWRRGEQGKGRGAIRKAAGGRRVSIVATWGRGEQEPLVVMTDGRARWPMLARAARRCWIAPGVRGAKRRGWQ